MSRKYDPEALEYHSRRPRGKLEIAPTKPFATQRDLSLAYSPGVADPCLAIHDNPLDVYEYTAKGNLVAVVSNGTAVLGLGNIGPAASKPVMEGKAVLFKRFADIDVFDLELDTTDPEEIIRTVKLLEPTFGGVNLEDIKAPECFHIEERLREELSIPVLHDDQHGTAIISGAGLLNALEVTGKAIEDIRVVFNGAGASGLACAAYYLKLGVRPENLVLCDSKGVVWKGRPDGMNAYKEVLASDTDARTLEEAMRGADVFAGLSVGGAVTPDMVRSMAKSPIILAMANPDPEISYDDVKAARPDAIVATGRSDYPNQVNNVLGFPFIFRGALDTRATAINEEMKLAATYALAALAKEDVPDTVTRAYGVERLQFGPDYLIPKPFDYRVLTWEATAVAEAAMKSGVAQRPVDLDEYREQLESRLGRSREVMRFVMHRARRKSRSVVFPEGCSSKVLRAAQIVVEERLAAPVLLGVEADVRRAAADLGASLEGIRIVDPALSPDAEAYAEELFRARQRKGVTRGEARDLMRNPTAFGAMMVRRGDAHALVAGVTQHYPDTMRPALQILGTRDDVTRVYGMFLMILKGRIYLLADTTVNIDPTAEQLAEAAVLSAEVARQFDLEPRVALLSFSNFGSVRHPLADKVRRAVELVRQREPELVVDGEMQADTAVSASLAQESYPFGRIQGDANVLIFPELQSANMAYKLLQRIGGAEAIGPILMGMRHPVQVLQVGMTVRDIVNMAAIAAAGSIAREREEAAV